MSYGTVICSACRREVHRSDKNWNHCEDGMAMCEGANAVYPKSLADIQGKWCGKDDLSVWRFRRSRVRPNAIGGSDVPRR